ncbi:hypothetical protein BDF22DRAFT_739519 [Syncephalis plumigaleata]|nr:hypothetical protein BDF22DRAFT_739519 [Syncephalis plumigaleata]
MKLKVLNSSDTTLPTALQQTHNKRSSQFRSIITRLDKESTYAELLTRIIHGSSCPPFTLSALRAYMIRENLNVAHLDFLSWHQEFAHRFFRQKHDICQQVQSPYSNNSSNGSNRSNAGRISMGQANSFIAGTALKADNNVDRFVYLGLVGVASPSAIDELNGSLHDRLLRERELLANMAENLSNIPMIDHSDYAIEHRAEYPFFGTGSEENIGDDDNATIRQPYRQFCEQAYAYFIAPDERLPLTKRQRSEIRRLLDRTTHPVLFSIAVHRCYYAIVTDVMPKFLHGGARNLTRVLRRFQIAFGILLVALSLSAALWMLFCAPNRWIRLSVAPACFMGVWAIIQGSGGICLVLTLLGKRAPITEIEMSDDASLSEHRASTPGISSFIEEHQVETSSLSTTKLRAWNGSLKLQNGSNCEFGMCPSKTDGYTQNMPSNKLVSPVNTSVQVVTQQSTGILDLEPVDTWLRRQQLRILMRMITIAAATVALLFAYLDQCEAFPQSDDEVIVGPGNKCGIINGRNYRCVYDTLKCETMPGRSQKTCIYIASVGKSCNIEDAKCAPGLVCSMQSYKPYGICTGNDGPVIDFDNIQVNLFG